MGYLISYIVALVLAGLAAVNIQAGDVSWGVVFAAGSAWQLGASLIEYAHSKASR